GHNRAKLLRMEMNKNKGTRAQLGVCVLLWGASFEGWAVTPTSAGSSATVPVAQPQSFPRLIGHSIADGLPHRLMPSSLPEPSTVLSLGDSRGESCTSFRVDADGC